MLESLLNDILCRLSDRMGCTIVTDGQTNGRTDRQTM